MAVTNLLREIYCGGFCDSDASLIGKTAIVTGSNSGIGKVTALDLAARGARVIVACRSEERGRAAVAEIVEKTKNERVIFMRLDLASFRSVRRFVDAFLEAEDRLDILVNNAGIMLVDSPLPTFNEDGIEMHLAVNHLGPFLLTLNLLGLLERSGPGSRVVNVASTMHDWANPAAFEDLNDLKRDGAAAGFHAELDRVLTAMAAPPASGAERIPAPDALMDAIPEFLRRRIAKPQLIRYSNSKLANILFTRGLARRMDREGGGGGGVSAYAVHPGVILTDLALGKKGKTTKEENWFSGGVKRLVSLVNPTPFVFFLKTPEQGAQTTICCAVGDKFAGESGLYYSDCAPVRVRRPEVNDDFVDRFWDWSESVVRTALRVEDGTDSAP